MKKYNEHFKKPEEVKVDENLENQNGSDFPKTMKVYKRSALTLRAEPSKDSKILKILNPDTKVKVLNEISEGWVRVAKYDGSEGFVLSEYLEEC